MKRFLLTITILFIVQSCSNIENQMILTGTVKGLKKGTLILQKIKDTLLVSVDSVIVNGVSSFSFSEIIESPEVYYLYVRLKDGSLQDDHIAFFAEPGEININTTLKNFEIDAIISGSKNQAQLIEYNKLMERYNNKNLDLIEQMFNAKKDRKDSLIMAIEKKQTKLLISRYLATVNYSLRINDFELAPYLMISQVYDISKKYLDTVYNTLTPKVKDSKYGRALESLIQSRSQLPESGLIK
ncbi:MAG: DUF4369 domain-containing protein [Bacteroidetes bacterium]|nr:DUF4369 domain-containing protein [Bacteroidota bacterium]